MVVMFTTCSLSVSGFTGVDCSIKADSPPVVRELISAPTCNMRDSVCNSVRVIAENFDMLTPITCKLVRIGLRPYIPTADAYMLLETKNVARQGVKYH